MSRRNRIEKVGFYHIVNRGVARNTTYHSDEDFLKFLEIVQDAGDEYDFSIYSFCLMSNHYHLLLRTSSLNLSIFMQKINSRYSVYYNNKYKRIGPLWQGRFKSWYVFDEMHLKSLVKYIEYNPIKAGITKKIGEYRWAMSSNNFELLMLNFELLKSINFDENITEAESQEIDAVFSTKLEMVQEQYKVKVLKPLENYFDDQITKEYAISKAIKGGYMGTDIAEYLGVTKANVSKIYTNYRKKIKLFERLRDKGIFWSYSKDMSYEECGEKLFIEYVFKYGDFDDIELCLKLYGKRRVKTIWEEKLKSDRSFIKINLMIARVFFGMDVEADYFKELKNERFEKLRLLAS